jgi:RNA polymerase sigma-70 factor (ECF subfamily)
MRIGGERLNRRDSRVVAFFEKALTRSEFVQLYESHCDSVHAFALNLTRDGDRAREILQEVFLRAARRPELGMPMGEARSWLFRLAHNLVIDGHRRAGTQARAMERVAKEPMSLFAPQADPDKEAFREAVAAAMATLPEEQRAVVHLKLWEDFSFSEIGEALGLSPNTAASRYRYALDKLQAQLRSLYEEIR